MAWLYGRPTCKAWNSVLMVCRGGRKCSEVEPRSLRMTGIEGLAHTHDELMVTAVL